MLLFVVIVITKSAWRNAAWSDGWVFFMRVWCETKSPHIKTPVTKGTVIISRAQYVLTDHTGIKLRHILLLKKNTAAPRTLELFPQVLNASLLEKQKHLYALQHSCAAPPKRPETD